MAVRVQQEDFDVGIESRTLQGPAVGAIALFVGTVRSLSEKIEAALVADRVFVLCSKTHLPASFL